MKTHLLPLPALLLLAACPGPDGGNPSRLWLTTNGSEVAVKLSEREPPHI